MYKVIKPLKGYGYQVGDVVSNIKEEDVPYFLHWKFIEEVKKVQDKPVKKTK